MTDESRDRVKDEFVKILSELSKPQQKLFQLVLAIESENLHLQIPRVKTELLDAVRKAIK